MSGRLEEIERRARTSEALSAWHSGFSGRTWRDDVMLLVEIAKAAQESAHRVECVLWSRCGNCDACRFNAALARLDATTTEQT